MTFRNWCVTFRPQFGAPSVLRPGADVPPCPPHYATDTNAQWECSRLGRNSKRKK